MSDEPLQKRIKEIPFPAVRHLPGTGTKPDSDFLHLITLRASEHTTDSTAADNVAWLYGIRLFNATFYWEAHEVWETVWMNATPNSRERSLVQACIHLTNAKLKFLLGNEKAADKLCKLTTDSLERCLNGNSRTLMGVSLAQMHLLSESNGNDKTDAGKCVTTIDCEYL